MESSTEEHRAIVNTILSEPKIQAEINNVFSTCEDNDETKSTIVNFMFNEKHQYQWFHTGEFGFDEITFKIVPNQLSGISRIQGCNDDK